MDKQAGLTSGAANINTAALSPALQVGACTSSTGLRLTHATNAQHPTQSLHSSVASSRDLSPVNPAFLLRASAPGLVAEGRSSTAQGRSRFPSPGARNAKRCETGVCSHAASCDSHAWRPLAPPHEPPRGVYMRGHAAPVAAAHQPLPALPRRCNTVPWPSTHTQPRRPACRTLAAPPSLGPHPPCSR